LLLYDSGHLTQRGRSALISMIRSRCSWRTRAVTTY